MAADIRSQCVFVRVYVKVEESHCGLLVQAGWAS
jgi:hypothetical protein